jgi:hypothetical protein
MASKSKVTFNIDVVTIYALLNILVQQSLSNLSNLSLDSLIRLLCWYEPLQLIMINEISFVGAKMFNVINYKLKVQYKTYPKQNFVVISILSW